MQHTSPGRSLNEKQLKAVAQSFGLYSIFHKQQAGVMTQVDHLPGKCEALGSSTAKQKTNSNK
jgi:hypothetical protein